jgi:hypothetical protein
MTPLLSGIILIGVLGLLAAAGIALAAALFRISRRALRPGDEAASGPRAPR